MPSNFVLRSEGDSQNPTAARLYGKGVTAGRVIFYQNNGEGSQTTFLAVLAQGARFSGDLGCDAVTRVYFAGFELPEFTGAVRNWKFHKGTVAKAPNYKAIQSVDIGTNVWQVNGHGFTSGNLIALHGRGDTVVIPASVFGITQHRQLMVWVVDANHIKILQQVSGAPDEGNTIDITSVGANLDKLFIYRADDAFYFDSEMGRSEFFPQLNFTFSGFSYIEVKLPVHLSDGEDEPSQLKVIMNGKQVYGITDTAGSVAFDTNVITGEPNPALVAADLCVHDAKMPATRLHGSSFVAWRDRADAVINWVGGNDNPAVRTSFPLWQFSSYDPNTAKLTSTDATFDGWVMTEEFTARYPVAEFTYRGGQGGAYFNNSTDPFSITRQGVECWGGYIRARAGGQVQDIIPVAAGDRIKVAYENGLLRIYKNSVPVPIVTVNQLQTNTTYRIQFHVGAGGTDYIDQMLVAPSGTNTLPRQVKRFYGGIVAVEPSPVSSLFETLVHLSGGCSWADVDGQVRIATEPDRTPCFTFYHYPDTPTKSNVLKVTPKRKSETQNFWLYTYRDLDDFILSRKYVTIDRKERRAALGGRLIYNGLSNYSVMTQSHMERIGEMNARLISDLDVGFTVEAFLDSLPVVKGSYVNLVDPTAGFPPEAPALCVVNEILYGFGGSDVETLTYELQVITSDYYSDTAHGMVTPVQNQGNQSAFTPPYPASDLTLTETSEPMPDNSYVSSISGVVTFGEGFNQHARVYTKTLTDKLGTATLDAGTDEFTLALGSRIPLSDEPLAIGSSVNDMPSPASHDQQYFAVNIDATARTFQLALTEGGAAIDFTSSGSALGIYGHAGWVDTQVDVYPNDSMIGGFELIPARRSLTVVRAETRSAANVAAAFVLHATKALNVVGETTAPLPPASASYYYDGVSIQWNWIASQTFGVKSYVLKDEANRFIAQVGGEQLSYAEPARADNVTRRIYAVNSTGVLSGGYAEVTFVSEYGLAWVNIVGATQTSPNAFLKTAADGWNGGGILSQALLTDRVPAKLSGAPDRNNVRQVLGFTRNPSPLNLTDFELALDFRADGTVWMYDNRPSIGTETSQVGTYQAGDRWELEIVPDLDWGEVSTAIVNRLIYENGVPISQSVATFSEAEIVGGYFAGFAFYTQGSISDLHVEFSGALIDSLGIIPFDLSDNVNVSWDVSTGEILSTGGTGEGSGGASFTNPLPDGADGVFEVTLPQSTTSIAFGLSPNATNVDYDSIPYRVEIAADSNYRVYTESSEITGDSFTDGDKFRIGRENGIPTVRLNGKLIHAWTGADEYMSQDLFLTVSTFHSQSVAEAFLRQYEIVSRDLGRTLVFGRVGAEALIGDQRVSKIPIFGISAPKEHESLVFNSAERLVNVRSRRNIATFLTDVVGDSGTDVTAYTATVPAGLIAQDGDRLESSFGVLFAANVNAKAVRLKFGGNVIFDSDDIGNSAIEGVHVKSLIVRDTDLTAKCLTVMEVSSVAGANFTNYIRLTSGLDYSSEELLELIIYAETADTDIYAKMGVVDFVPAYPAPLPDGEDLAFRPPENVALPSAGSTVTASSEINASFPVSAVTDGLRHTNNAWGTGGGWNSAGDPSVSPEWVEVDFGQLRTITEVDVFTLADSSNYNTDPTLTDTFTAYGITDFTVQYWDGSAWVTQDTVASNNKVWRQFFWPNIETTKIRIRVTGAYLYARLVEVEAWGF